MLSSNFACANLFQTLKGPVSTEECWLILWTSAIWVYTLFGQKILVGKSPAMVLKVDVN